MAANKRGFFSAVVLSLVMLLVLAGCLFPGQGEWEYDLPNDYGVIMINSYNYVIVDRRSDNGFEVENLVLSFCHNDRFVCVQRIVPEDQHHATREERRTKEPEFFIIDTAERVRYGPFDEAGFEEQCEILSITDLGEWKRTDSMPEGAVNR